MRKRIIICALSVFLLILSGVLAFYLHGQNRPIAGLSGDNRTLLRVWMLHSPGGAARWVETQLSAYERQHPGVLIYLRQVSADELTAEETLLPDVVLYRPDDAAGSPIINAFAGADARAVSAGEGGRGKLSAAFPRWMRAVRPAGNFRESGVPALDGRLRAAAVRHGVPALPGAEMRLGDADDGASGGVFGADERRQGLSVPGDGRADGHDGAGAAFVDLRGCAGWRGGLAVVSRKPGRTGAAGASRAVFGAGGFGAVPVGLGGGGGAGGAAGDCHAGCVPVGRGFAAKSMAGLSVIVLPVFIQLPSASRCFPRAAPPEFCRRGSQLPRLLRHRQHFRPHSRD